MKETKVTKTHHKKVIPMDEVFKILGVSNNAKLKIVVQVHDKGGKPSFKSVPFLSSKKTMDFTNFEFTWEEVI